MTFENATDVNGAAFMDVLTETETFGPLPPKIAGWVSHRIPPLTSRAQAYY